MLSNIVVDLFIECVVVEGINVLCIGNISCVDDEVFWYMFDY